MEEIDSSKNSHVSFLSLLMAPDDETTPPDHHIHHTTPLHHHHLLLPFPSSSSYDQQQLQHPAFPYYDHNVAYNYDNTHFLPPLPELLSLETPTPPPPPPPPPMPPYGQKDDFTLGSIVANFRASRESRSNNNKHLPPLQRPQPNEPLCRARTRTRTRQSKISEKVYNLGKLLPGGHRHRNSTADMLEEAYKYINFLKAQVSVLTSMPTHDINNNINNNNIIINSSGNYNYHDNNNNSSDINGQSCALEKLARLSRQQLLQVVLNSPAAQVVMADNGWCLYSAEQVAVIQRAQARQKIIQQLLSSLPL